MDIYREEILDHYKNPRNWGVIKGGVLRAEGSNSHCGDRVEMSVLVDRGKIKDIKFKGEGCAISTAGASMLTEKIRGMSLVKAKRLTKEKVIEEMGIKLSPSREKCARLGFEVWQKLLEKLI